jgi:hypothetical protein
MVEWRVAEGQIAQWREMPAGGPGLLKGRGGLGPDAPSNTNPRFGGDLFVWNPPPIPDGLRSTDPPRRKQRSQSGYHDRLTKAVAGLALDPGNTDSMLAHFALKGSYVCAMRCAVPVGE